MPDKLQRAVDWHLNERQYGQIGLSQARLYASTTVICNEKLCPLAISKRPNGELCFEGAMIQNVLTGNTMVMNAALVKVLQKIQPAHSVWHDWSAYQVATACGGRVYLDENPSVLYRQHASNLLGDKKRDLQSQHQRLKENLRGRYKTRITKNLLAASDIWGDLTPASQRVCVKLQRIKEEPKAYKRLILVLRSGLKREGIMGLCAFWIACVFGWV